MKIKCVVIFASILIFLVSTNSFGQETKRKRKVHGRYVEEFFVLNEDKDIKQGEYAKFWIDVFGRNIPVEYGQYTNNKRTGYWYFFYKQGQLKSFGPYVEGQKQGEWREYDYPIVSEESVFEAAFNEHSAAKIGKKGKLVVKKEEKEISATGLYDKGDRTGVWNYYGEGKLVHKYNYSTGELIYSALSDSVNRSCPYLGGALRLFNQYLIVDRMTEYTPVNVDSKVDLTIDIKSYPVIVKIAHFEGEKKYADRVVRIIEQIPDDWIRSMAEEPLFYTSKMITKPDSTLKSLNNTISNIHFMDGSKQVDWQ